MKRRKFLGAASGAVLLTSIGVRDAFSFGRPQTRFLHGVASGDPTANAVIIWTRVSPVEQGSTVVHWQVATDARLRHIVRQGTVTTDPSRDYTVKIDVDGLQPGTQYFYRFTANRRRSTVGRTRTLPRGAVGEAKFAVVTCSNYPAGFFNVYREIAQRDDLDAVLHLGDYIYEYGMGEYATDKAEALGRVPEPVGELLALQDYRQRHALYKTDPDSQAMHASLPMIAVWDDHEIANDAWRGGAANHQPDEGDWETRRKAAMQAYFEWMPIRGVPNGKGTRIFRDFRWGDLASLVMLDTRHFGRDVQPNVGDAVTGESIKAALQDPSRRMLGAEQEAWLRERLRAARGTTWQVIGQQVMVTSVAPPDLEPLVDRNAPTALTEEELQQRDAAIAASKSHHPQAFDSWDGYPVARHDFLGDLANLATNPVVLSGDLHTALAANLVPSDGERPVAVEYMTTSVSSPGLAETFPDKTPHGVRDGLLEQNPDMKYLNITQRGWLCMTLTAEQCTGEWHLLDTVFSRDYQATLAETLSVRAGEIRKGLFQG